MEDVQANNVEFVLKSVDDQNMIIQDPKEINDQCNLKTTGYLLDVTSNPIAAGSQDGQFVTADAICQDNQGTQFVTLEVENTDQIILQEKEVILWNDICRICANGSDRFIPIFTGDGLEHDLCTKIQTYLPLQVSEEDSLPHQICYNCAATLLAWHDIYKGCIDAQQRLIELQNKIKDQYYNESTIAEENNQAVLEVQTSNIEEPQIQAKDEEQNNTESEQVVNIAESERAFSSPSSSRSSSPPMDAENQQEQSTVSSSNKKDENYTYMCGVCDKMYNEEFELLLHLIDEHKVSMSGSSMNPVLYECNVCSKTFMKKSNLLRHTKIHNKDLPGEDGVIERSKIFVNKVQMFQCDHCDSLLTSRRCFIRHLRIHTNERPIICHICGKDFRIAGDLKRHIDDVHDKIKRFACDICGTSFAAKSTRDAHRRIHTGEKPYKCNTCDKHFRSINLLGVHKKTHTDYRPHKCQYCDKAFRDRQKLKIHESIHTGVRPFSCDICGKSFPAKGELGRHRVLHFDERPHLCSVCGMSFKISRYLRTHIRQYHKDQAEILIKALDNH